MITSHSLCLSLTMETYCIKNITYLCKYPVWHSSLTITQSMTLELLQKRAIDIIFQYMDYKLSLIMVHIDTLEERQEVLTEQFFRRGVMPETSCLHYLLFDKRDSYILNKLWCPKISQPLTINTVKFKKSFRSVGTLHK